MAKNYYIILGVPFGATQADIKAAYRRLAKELHPDHYGKNQTPFQVLQEAYAVLSDPESRRSYDNSLDKTARGDQPQQREPVRHHFEEIIEPLIPEQGSRFIRKGFPENCTHDHWPIFDRMYDSFFQDPVERKRAYRRLLALLREVM
jgi:curved DNA-binding protein CbpA